MGDPDVSIIVMAYNEESSIADVVRDISNVMAASRFAAEVVIVDDGSTDGTSATADELALELPCVHVVHHDNNRGIGEVYATGFGRARGTYITFLPADGQFPAEIVPRFADLMSEHDLVLGFLPDVVGRRSLLARILSSAEKLLYRAMFGPLPRFQGVMMFRRNLLRRLDVKSRGRSWVVLLELIVKSSHAGLRIVSVPTSLRPRASGQSKVNNLSTIIANLRQAMDLRIRLSAPR